MQRIEDQVTSRPRLSLSDTPQIESVLNTQYTPTTLCANECVRERTGRREQEQGNSKGKGQEGKKKAREKEREPLLSSLAFTFFALLYFLRFTLLRQEQGTLKRREKESEGKESKGKRAFTFFSLAFTFFPLALLSFPLLKESKGKGKRAFTFFACLYFLFRKGKEKQGKREAREKRVKASEPLLSSLAK